MQYLTIAAAALAAIPATVAGSYKEEDFTPYLPLKEEPLAQQWCAARYPIQPKYVNNGTGSTKTETKWTTTCVKTITVSQTVTGGSCVFAPATTTTLVKDYSSAASNTDAYVTTTNVYVTATDDYAEPTDHPDVPPVEDEEPPVVEEPPVEGEEPPVDGEEPPVDGEEPPVDGEEPPAEGEEPPVEGEEPPVVEEPPIEEGDDTTEGEEGSTEGDVPPGAEESSEGGIEITKRNGEHQPPLYRDFINIDCEEFKKTACLTYLQSTPTVTQYGAPTAYVTKVKSITSTETVIITEGGKTVTPTTPAYKTGTTTISGPPSTDPTPYTPEEPTPDTPDETTPDTPDETTPDTPDETTPDTPDETTPDTPDEPIPDTPDEPTPDTPDEPVPDEPTPNDPPSTDCPATSDPVLHTCNHGDDPNVAPSCNADNSELSCSCYTSTEGSGYCGNAAADCGPECETSADCTCGQVCLTASSTGCGFSTCSTSQDSVCGNGVAARSIFAIRGVKRGILRHPTIVDPVKSA